MSKKRFAALGLGFLVLTVVAINAQGPTEKTTRSRAQTLMQAGNWKEAYALYRKLALDPGVEHTSVSQDLQSGLQCLIQLGIEDETDDFIESVVAAQKGNWRLLQTAAQSYANLNHHGFIVAGKFFRGYRRGNGKQVTTLARDRVRALQLMEQAMPLVARETEKDAAADFHFHYANLLLNGAGYEEAWRLQYLTDLTQLPDYEEGHNYFGRHGGHQPRTPVDVDGNPVYHKVPKTLDVARSDGERWRWMLERTVELNPSRKAEVAFHFAQFCDEQFGVQTLLEEAWSLPGPAEDDANRNESGTYALHTLRDNETIARLASGIKRFTLPDGYNPLKLYQQIAAAGKSQWGEQARDAIASSYENRRQYVKSADAWKTAIREYGVGADNHRQLRLDQIVGNWGRFERTGSQAAGSRGKIDYRYRNGKKVTFEAHDINVGKLIDDVTAYLKRNPQRLDWNEMNINDIGHRLVTDNQTRYLGEKTASWSMDLKPRPEHVDSRVTVATPMQKAGAYLVTAKMQDGNTSHIIVWLDNTAIVKKQLDGKTLYFVADAVSGQPLARTRVDFFGWRQEQIGRTNNFRVVTTQFAETTDGDGQILVDQQRLPSIYQWLITCRTEPMGAEEARLAYLGFSHVWYGRHHDHEYNQMKVYLITDRPVYRPQQAVQFKFWVRHARYDQEDTSTFANQNIAVRLTNPKGEKVFEKILKADKYGGVSGEYVLPKDTTLGVYSLHVPNRGGGTFRVEEYKKPEFEVKVEAPTEPVMLGEKIDATIEARYYFGSPVTSAKVKYKVTRTEHTTHWYPPGAWDWFYGKGYWWFAPDFLWYPGFAEWGCSRPIPWWYGYAPAPPEVVMENEVSIGPDGKVKVTIDTLVAKEMHGNQDHQYAITAEVTDESRRTIVGTGNVLVARKPFKVHAWVNRGHYRVGDDVEANFAAFTLDQKPVQGTGRLTLFRITYDDKRQPVETPVQVWNLDTDAQGIARQQFAASKAGQYRLSYKVTDAKQHSIEGGYLFVIRGEGFDGRAFRFNDLELITDKREYAPGDTVKLLINTNRDNGCVALFVRPANGICLPPKIIRLNGKSTLEEIAVVKKDMPNFFIEAMTIANGKIHDEIREVIVPPEKRVLDVSVVPSQSEYLPGQEAKIKLKLTDFAGKPFVGSTVVSIYDRSVEYISGGSNVPEIREFFWKWRRQHRAQTESSLARAFWNLLPPGDVGMGNLGIFGEGIIDELAAGDRLLALGDGQGAGGGLGLGGGVSKAAPRSAMAPASGRPGGMAGPAATVFEGAPVAEFAADAAKKPGDPSAPPEPQAPLVQPTIRSNFADTALWVAALETNGAGEAEVRLKMPENLTAWKVKCWALGHGTKVGQGDVEVVTRKNLIVRLQAPRFFVEKDEVVLSANVHNYLKKDKSVAVAIELDGKTLALLGDPQQRVEIKAGGEQRVDWRVKVTREGRATVRMKALTDEESDAMEMTFPVYVHGMLKMDSFAGVIRPEMESGAVKVAVPAQRRIDDSRLEVRFSPTLAGAMVDALPYLVEYPYGCTEQTLNRFLPTVITQNILKRMNLDLKSIREKRTNLNAQELGDAAERARGWKRYPRNPVFDEAEVQAMVADGMQALKGMQVSDGGWGWFSGFGEHSYPHTTAVVVHGLQIARENGVVLPDGMLERGVAWLKAYQGREVQKIKNFPQKVRPLKEHVDELDAFVYMVLLEEDHADAEMMEFLYRDRNHLAVYGKALFGIALHKQKQQDKLAMVLRNIEQFLVQDDENQTAYLRLPNSNPWWNWYGSEVEANAYYLKLLSRVNAKDERASRLVKYLLNNRKHATFWNSTRDTALAIEAMAEYMKLSGEDRPDLTIEVYLDGQKQKEVAVNASNLFTFDNSFVLFGDAVTTGQHTIELKKKGTGPLYYNAYLTNFTLEDFITKAGLEVKVNRKYYKLTPADKEIKVPGARGQALDQKVEKYQRTELPNLSVLKSGDLVEIELEIDSKNDYEYLVFEDMKAAGFEPVEVRSGYNGNDMGAYVEFRDERVCFFVRSLARGKHSVSYRLRAEIPGKFSALPTRASGMYAPELRANSDEMKVGIVDR